MSVTVRYATAIDIDGCLFNFCDVWCRTCNEVLGTNLSGIAKTWDMTTGYDLTQEQVTTVWNSPELEHNWANAPVIEAGLGFAKGCPPGSMYVTARGNNLVHENAIRLRQMTIEALLHHGFPEFPIAYRSDKLAVVDDYMLDCALEDQPEQALEYAKTGIEVYMPVYEYNKHVSHNNIIRLEDWK